MKKLRQTITHLAAALGIVSLGVLVPVATPAFAAPLCTGSGLDCVTQGAGKAQTGNGNTTDLAKVIKTIVNILLFAIGAISVIMIILGGIKYTTSNGNAEQIKSAKNTIMYAIIGLVVAILAYAIVNFVIKSLAG